MKDLKIISFTKKELKAAIDGAYYDHTYKIGLSKNKIYWLLNNERIADDDYCLVQAKDGDILAADIFMMPDIVRTKTGQQLKVYWMVNWWLHPAYEKTIIGSYIYSEASALAGHKVLIESYLENTKQFYDKQPYMTIADRTRFVIFFGIDEHLVVSKISALKPIKFFIKPFTKFTSYLIKTINKSKAKKRTQQLSYEYINNLNEATWQFIAPFLTEDITYKTKEYINWQLSAEQYLRTPISSKSLNDAVIKGTAQDIHNCSFSVYKLNVRIGFVSFVRIDKTIYLKYLISAEIDSHHVTNAFMEHLLHYKITSIYTDNENLSKHIHHTYMTIYTHTTTKKALAHKIIAEKLEDLTLSESDGNFH